MTEMKLIRTLKSYQSFDVSIWLTNKGYRLQEDYYLIGKNEFIPQGRCEMWALNIHKGYAIIKINQDPFDVYILDMEGDHANHIEISYYMETGKQPSYFYHKGEFQSII